MMKFSPLMNNCMRFILLVMSGLPFIACGSGDEPVTPPSNLNIEAVATTDGSGKVNITAAATNAAYYAFTFGEHAGDTPVENTTGSISYKYAMTGTYTITVEAHATEAVFIAGSTTVDVEIFVNIPEEGYTTPEEYEGMTLLWADEFEGSAVNGDDWTFEKGDGCPNVCGWGNNELEYYQDKNATLQDGYLVIEARAELVGGKSYTSTRMISQGKMSFKYGRVDIRAVLPEGQGIWPALWMLGSNISSVGWPACGEIDIMEMIGGSDRENTVYGTAHWQSGGDHASYGGPYTLNSGTFGDAFHVFSIVWDSSKISWYVDDELFKEIDITPSDLSEFQGEFFLIFNVAVGGDWPGNPDAFTKFPQHMIVDYVRVFQQD